MMNNVVIFRAFLLGQIYVVHSNRKRKTVREIPRFLRFALKFKL